jgi:hypothetical protein
MPRFADIDAGRVGELERALEIREGFLAELERDDDWSYIVKLHTFMEAAVSHLLVKAFEDARLDKTLRSLPLGSLRSGKLAFLRALDLLGDSDMRFVRFVSELRDVLVGRIQSVSFSISSHFAERGSPQIPQLFRAWGFAANPDEERALLLHLFQQEPRLFIHVRGLYLLELSYLGRPFSEAQRIGAASLAELARAVDGSQVKE